MSITRWTLTALTALSLNGCVTGLVADVADERGRIGQVMSMPFYPPAILMDIALIPFQIPFLVMLGNVPWSGCH